MPNTVELGQQNLERGRYEVAFDIFMDLAQYELNEEAQYALVKMCFDGHMDPEQIEKLFKWLNYETEIGNGYSYFNIGLLYEKGLGNVEHNLKVAIEYYQKAVLADVIDAYCNLGNIYVGVSGDHPELVIDIPKGISLLAKGAELGSRQAAYTLGCLYEKGELVKQDHSKAFYNLTLATLAKHDQAHRCLIIMQHAVKKDFTKEFDAAERAYWRLEGERRMYRQL